MGAKTKLQLDEAGFLVEASGVVQGCECEDRVTSFRFPAHILAILASIQMICSHCINGGYMWIYVWVHVIRMMYVH